jgi:surface protein
MSNIIHKFLFEKKNNKKIPNSILLDLDHYSFKANYHTDSEKEKITLFRNTSFEIKEMIIDGEKIEPSLEYNFASIGDHVIYVLLDISKTNSLHGMFSGITKLTSVSFSPLFDTQNIQLMGYMFYGASSLSYVDYSNFKAEKVTNMDSMFLGCSSLISLDLSNFNTKNVIFMDKMFSGCKSLTSLDLSNFDTPNLTKMSYMFSGCSSLKKIILSNFNTELVTDMEGLFFDCSSLSSVDLSNFNTKNVLSMGNMFYKCSKLISINLSNFNTIKVLN